MLLCLLFTKGVCIEVLQLLQQAFANSLCYVKQLNKDEKIYTCEKIFNNIKVFVFPRGKGNIFPCNQSEM